MRFSKSKFFWIPIAICFITGIVLQILLSFGLAENTNNSPPPILGGLIAGLALGFFFWMVFGRVDKIRIPKDLKKGYSATIQDIGELENSGTFIRSNVKPEITLFNEKITYNLFGKKDIHYKDILETDIYSQKQALEGKLSSLVIFGNTKFRIFVNDAVIKLRDKQVILRMHWESNLIELLSLLKEKKVKLSLNAQQVLVDKKQ